MNKKIGMFALAIVSVILMTSFIFAQGFGGHFGGKVGIAYGDAVSFTDEEKAEKQAERESIITAIENNDYSTWKSLMEAQLTQDRFDKIVEKHDKRSEVRDLMNELREAREADDQDRVDELRAELKELKPDRNGNAEGRGRSKFGRSDENGRRGFFQRFRGFFSR